MFGASLVIVLSAIAILAIPADMGTFRDGAQTIVGLQGMCFCGIAIIRGIWLAWINRATIRQFWKEVIDAQ